jgi:hypothetical protein
MPTAAPATISIAISVNNWRARRPRGPDRRSYGQLTRSRRPPRQQKIGDVGASDGEQTSGGAHQDFEERANIARAVFSQRLQDQLIVAEQSRKVGLTGGVESVEIAPRLGHRNARFEPSEDRPGRHALVAMAGGGGNGECG